MRHFAHALEDLPDEVRQQAAEIAATQPGISLRQRVLDEIETAGLDLYGALEQAPLLHFLARYPVTPYTYQLTALVARGHRPDAGLTYVHCEAGKARTGVVIACYRMAVLGWSAADALTEAVNFGCSVPGQQAFIREFGELLLAGGPAAGRYPLLPPGSVKPTLALLAATLASVAAAEQNQVR